MEARRLFRVTMEGEAGGFCVHLGGVQFLPSDKLHPVRWAEKRENFDAEWAENQIGVAGEADGEAGEKHRKNERRDGPSGMRELRIDVAVDGRCEERDRDGGANGGCKPEHGGLSGAGEAQFLFGRLNFSGHSATVDFVVEAIWVAGFGGGFERGRLVELDEFVALLLPPPRVQGNYDDQAEDDKGRFQ